MLFVKYFLDQGPEVEIHISSRIPYATHAFREEFRSKAIPPLQNPRGNPPCITTMRVPTSQVVGGLSNA